MLCFTFMCSYNKCHISAVIFLTRTLKTLNVKEFFSNLDILYNPIIAFHYWKQISFNVFIYFEKCDNYSCSYKSRTNDINKKIFYLVNNNNLSEFVIKFVINDYKLYYHNRWQEIKSDTLYWSINLQKCVEVTKSGPSMNIKKAYSDWLPNRSCLRRNWNFHLSSCLLQEVTVSQRCPVGHPAKFARRVVHA